MTFSPITVFLMRKNMKDDVIRICPDEETGSYKAFYEDRDSESAYMFHDSWEEMEAYLAQIFAVLTIDQEPFIGVQFSMPAYPSIKINTEDATDPSVMDPIWSILQTVARGWPMTLKKCSSK